MKIRKLQNPTRYKLKSDGKIALCQVPMASQLLAVILIALYMITKSSYSSKPSLLVSLPVVSRTANLLQQTANVSIAANGGSEPPTYLATTRKITKILNDFFDVSFWLNASDHSGISRNHERHNFYSF